MKKISFIALFIISFYPLQAQLQFGIKAGINQTTFNATYVSDVTYTPKTNFNAGVIVSFPLGSAFSLQPEAVYSGQGANINTTNVNGVYKYQMLNFPVLIKIVIVSHFFAETGPQVGFTLGAKIYEGGYPTTNIKSQTKSPDYSWTFGVGYQLPMNLGLDIRYNLGLTDLAKDGSNSYNDGSVKNSVIQVGIYYIFGDLFPAEKN